jgi:thioredoxin reductase
MSDGWDCVVVGGGAAGLSASLVLGRARKRTLVVDAGEQSNRAAHGIGGFLGFDGKPPAQLYAEGRDELGRYPSVEVRGGEVVYVSPNEGGFAIELSGGGVEQVSRVLLAMGMRYQPVSVPGVEKFWGTSVFQCPFCHGWEVRDQPLAVIARGEMALHGSLTLTGWTDDIVLLTNGPSEFSDEQRAQLAGKGIRIDERPLARLTETNGELDGVEFSDGATLARSGVMVSSTLHQRSALAATLGLEFAPPNPLSSETLAVDPFGQTSMPNVFAAGDVATMMPQVASAVASGSLAAVSVVRSLI